MVIAWAGSLSGLAFFALKHLALQKRSGTLSWSIEIYKSNHTSPACGRATPCSENTHGWLSVILHNEDHVVLRMCTGTRDIIDYSAWCIHAKLSCVWVASGHQQDA